MLSRMTINLLGSRADDAVVDYIYAPSKDPLILSDAMTIKVDDMTLIIREEVADKIAELIKNAINCRAQTANQEG